MDAFDVEYLLAVFIDRLATRSTLLDAIIGAWALIKLRIIIM